MAAEPLSTPGEGAERPRDIGLPEIPGYRIEETLGRGSTGVVYRATQLAVERQVALKVLHPDLAGKPRAVRRLQREARTTARLAHPNIVSAIDMGQVGLLWWYAMELVEGESLAERLKRAGRLSEREALRLFAPLVDALDHAFRQGVVHRDIKPANVLIDSTGRARLVDLGLAFREDDPLITSPGSTLGTPHYVSPEQARDPGGADARSDIWSLGATLYHAVCGRPPFPGDSVAEILSGVLYGRVADPRELEPRLSRGLALVLRKCLSRDPARRYQTPRELLDDLERCREKRPVQVQASALDPVRRARGRRVRWVWAACIALLLVALGVWLAGEVLAPGTPTLDDTAPTAATWPELEAIALAAARPDARPAPVLLALSGLGQPPTRFVGRYQQIEEGLLARLREDQEQFLRRLDADLERLLVQRDFVAAQALVGPQGFASRARAELSLDAVQFEQLERLARLVELRQRVERELASYVAEFSARLQAHLDQAFFADVANELSAGRWRSARALLERDPLELVRAAGLVVAGLPPEAIEALEVRLRGELGSRREELEQRWRRLDAELAAWIEREAARLELELRARRQERPAADELAERYTERCQELKLVDGERLPDQVSAEAPRRLERLSGELVALERSLAHEDALAWLDNARREAEALHAERRYRELVRGTWRWALERDWLATVREEVELELRSDELVAALLERAALGVQDLDGQRTSLLVRSIERSGRLEAGQDPLALGFRLESDVGTVALALRPLEVPGGPRPYVLPPEALERFAGLPPDPARTADPRERLARALLRFREGDTRGALDCLPLPPTGDGVLDAVASRLTAEVSRRDAELRQEQHLRAREAEERLNIILRAARGARQPVEREAAARQIDELLERYGDVAPVRARAAELRRLRGDLAGTAGPSTQVAFEQAFGPTSVALTGADVRLGFDFGLGFAGPWSSGDWREDADGWVAPTVRSLDEVVRGTHWPRLELGPPLDLAGPLEVVWHFEQPQDSGSPRLLGRLGRWRARGAARRAGRGPGPRAGGLRRARRPGASGRGHRARRQGQGLRRTRARRALRAARDADSPARPGGRHAGGTRSGRRALRRPRDRAPRGSAARGQARHLEPGAALDRARAPAQRDAVGARPGQLLRPTRPRRAGSAPVPAARARGARARSRRPRPRVRRVPDRGWRRSAARRARGWRAGAPGPARRERRPPAARGGRVPAQGARGCGRRRGPR